MIAIPGLVEAGEPVQNSLTIGFRDTRAIILDNQRGPPTVHQERYMHRLRSIPNCVLDQVAYKPIQ